jgi:RNA polymerase sigma factor (sigma-70 family)
MIFFNTVLFDSCKNTETRPKDHHKAVVKRKEGFGRGSKAHKKSNSFLGLCMKKMSLIDVSRWEAFKNGDVQAYKALYEEYVGFLLNYGLRLYHELGVVEDCVQEVFVDVWQYRQTLATPDDLRFYLMKSLRNRLGKYYRRHQPFVSGFDESIELPFLIEPSSEQRLIQLQIDAELRQKIQAALQLLSPRQREIIYLRYFNDMNYEQICELMNINYQTARTQHYNALKALRSSLQHTHLPFSLLFVYYFS